MSDTGTFRTTIMIENVVRRGEIRVVGDALVDTGSEYTWIPADVLANLGIRPEHTQRFIVADGRQLDRPVGIAIVHAAGAKAPDFVVFAEPGDMVLLGARSLEGLNVRVDAQRKQLVPAGPILAGMLVL
ncbi:MAG TPA: retroviral-like aspartic protease family protein [Gemmatimonadaceae bacterium]|nr:retroviral-like aspartic protease family protein [Gemmatimonadaceae bacterium]